MKVKCPHCGANFYTAHRKKKKVETQQIDWRQYFEDIAALSEQGYKFSLECFKREYFKECL